MIPSIVWGDNFAGLTKYLIAHRDHEVLGLRHVTSIENAAVEMQLVAAASNRVIKPVMHVSFSAAAQDGVLSREKWLNLVDAADAEFDLCEHQRVVVRHRDKDYDHIHVFWCTINPQTGQTPAKQFFRRRGAVRPELDQSALTVEDLQEFPKHQIAKGAFNRFALARLMFLCRKFEREGGLRQLKDRSVCKAAREEGRGRQIGPKLSHREERTGRHSVLAFADQIRAALDEPNYSAKRAALNLLGFDLDLVTRMRRDGSTEVRGLVVMDIADPLNRAPASAFDLATKKFGMRQLEKRHEPGAPTIEDWWPSRGNRISATLQVEQPKQELREIYVRERREHEDRERLKAEQRKRLLTRQAAQRKRLRARLMQLRKRLAERLQPSMRRRFYTAFAQTTRALIWAAQQRRHMRERMLLVRSAFLSWQQYRNKNAAAEARPNASENVSTTSLPSSQQTSARKTGPAEMFDHPRPALTPTYTIEVPNLPAKAAASAPTIAREATVSANEPKPAISRNPDGQQNTDAERNDPQQKRQLTDQEVMQILAARRGRSR